MFEQDQTWFSWMCHNYYNELYKNVNNPEFEHHNKTVYPDID